MLLLSCRLAAFTSYEPIYELEHYQQNLEAQTFNDTFSCFQGLSTNPVDQSPCLQSYDTRANLQSQMHQSFVTSTNGMAKDNLVNEHERQRVTDTNYMAYDNFNIVNQRCSLHPKRCRQIISGLFNTLFVNQLLFAHMTYNNFYSNPSQILLQQQNQMSLLTYPRIRSLNSRP
jgi:hypothetical protein